MNFKDYIKNIIFFPLVKGQIQLNTSKKDFLDKLSKVTDNNFDLGRSFNLGCDKYTHKYQCEISGSNFKLRRINDESYRVSFIGTIVYCKLIEKNNQLTFKHFIVFNILGNFFLCISILAVAYGTIMPFISHTLDFSTLAIALLCYATFVIVFRATAADDIGFVNSLIKFNCP